ncbi:hypothetical protein P153DRAFT_430989 [Dothidotthia symphoricarpi CBS 119687]|uniref:Nucleoporin Nup159/Nup146 N-terminal domain-containing protein n=1 Tax=Dothidotthia symphoricarpi CBS 119687 TaxID=1392245 RepID=A0A6A6AG55_9PLEO|nr:uncharacterized protein P153DRAFT_430989 [Dothidotthia symphoricarpi CBS 119687]KAF2129897.1 hypothetical protein P153DRAFT_430989 [Dothidotthia symphoricarpi CBS 119687]
MAFAGNAPAAVVASEVSDIETEHIALKALAQAKKLKLLPTPWSSASVPPPSATLLSIASRPGLLAAAGPDTLVVTSTETVRKAFSKDADNEDVISDFAPDVTLPVPTLRHVVFSADGDFLVISAETQGGLAVFETAKLMGQQKNPERQIATDGTAVRALVPNPAATTEHYMAVVLDSGKLIIANIDDGVSKAIKNEGVHCVAWSTRGKAVVAGLQDGTCTILMSSGDVKGTVPRPPGVEQGWIVSGLYWLNNEEFLTIHSPGRSHLQDNEDSKYHIVKSNKGWTSFEFHQTPWDPLLPSQDLPPRTFPPRFSFSRLRNWEPDLDDMIILTSSHTESVTLFTSTSKNISPYQETLGEYMMTNLDEKFQATLPRRVFGEEGDSALIGAALDLSSTEKILRPIASLEEIEQAPWPLPAYMTLTHQGILSAYWVAWNRSIEAGTRYPGLIFGSEETKPEAVSTPKAAPPSASQSRFGFGQPANSSPSTQAGGSFGKPAASTFGTPSTPKYGSTGFGSTTPGFGTSTTPAFGQSTTPATFAKPAPPAFGQSTTPAFGKPAQPAFGSASSIGAGGNSSFGTTGGVGNKQSPWGAAPSASQTPPAAANPFSSAANGSSGFAKFGQTNGGSAFSSFGSPSSAQSGFGSLGQAKQSSFGSLGGGAQSGFGAMGQGPQKSAFSGAPNGAKTEPSFGSTVTVGSSTGSTLPSFANTPSQQGSSVFGKPTSSFGSNKASDASDENRKRDGATPTAQAPQPQQSKGLFGLAGGFKLGTSFSSDGTAKDDPAKPAAPSNGSFFGSDFSSTLSGTSKIPATPTEQPGKTSPWDVSTTPASPPKQQKSLFSSATPARESATPKAPPPAKEKAPASNDAPLPPDFITTKPSKPVDDDLPPIAGSPPVNVEAPSSSPEASPIGDEDDEEEFSVEEAEDDEEGEADMDEGSEESGDEEDEDEEESPSKVAPVSRPLKLGNYAIQDSVNNSPHSYPPAPTPPVKSEATSRSGRSISPPRPSLFGEVPKPSSSQSRPGSSLFGQQAQKAPFSLGQPSKANQPSAPAMPVFPPPTNRVKEDLRSPSPMRSSSTSALRTRREPLAAPGSSLSASLLNSKPPTPQPQVSDLEDDEAERMHAQLAQEVEPRRTLDQFVAYQNYAGGSNNKTGSAAQIEMVYKDLNGMVDTLGWNARSLKAFTQYHKQPQQGHEVSREALDEVESDGVDDSWFEKWNLCEIEDLKALEDELERGLDAGRVGDVFAKLNLLGRLLNEKAKFMTRLNDIRRQIVNRKDPDKLDSLRKAPLPKELADSQKALRNDYARLLTLLNQAEEGAFVLRSRLASHNADQGKTAAVPTMDAVKKTVNKMIALAEKRTNDIAVLEAQMRNLGLADLSSSRASLSSTTSSSRAPGTTTPRRGRTPALRNSTAAATPFATPPTSRAKMSLSELNRRAMTPGVDDDNDNDDATPTGKPYGLFYTPLAGGGPAPKRELAGLADLVDDNLDALRGKAGRRRVVARGLRGALVERGVRCSGVA